MRLHQFKTALKVVVTAASILLLAAGTSFAQYQQVNLTAGPATLALPDGQVVPMWGYTCKSLDSTVTSSATCAALSKNATGWSPVVITVPSGQKLQINLTNSLKFTTPTGTNSIPTSIVVVGQLGGGLGAKPTTSTSPTHAPQGATWPITNGAINNPPPQGPRVQSFATEVAAGNTTPLYWDNLKPGTYLIESGTHPSIQGPMGLYGILVVTTAPGGGNSGTAYTGVSYDSEIPLLFSEIDPNMNRAVSAAVVVDGFQESATLGSYAQEPVGAVVLLNGGTGYTTPPTVTFSGGGAIPANVATGHTVIDTTPGSPTLGQVTSIVVDSPGSGYTSNPAVVFSGGGGSGASAEAALELGTSSKCSNGASACYPPAVNYTPFYYLINGTAFDKSNAGMSRFASSASPKPDGSVLVRLVNAGLRMHVPSIVGSQIGTAVSPAVPPSGFSLIAEDGNLLPGVPRVQSEVFMAAGKTYDVMINVPAAGATALPIYDRQLSLSANSTNRDSGMLAYISVNGADLPQGVSALTSAVANPDTYNAVIPGQTLKVSDPSRGVLANDVNVMGVKVSVQPLQGTLTLDSSGTFTYVAAANWSGPDTFRYCGNGATDSTSNPACTTVTLNPEDVELAKDIKCGPSSYTSSLSTSIKINPPGVLANCTDGAGYPLKVALSAASAPVPSDGLTLSVDARGGFIASAKPGAYTFTFSPQNSQGTVGSAATVSVTFPPPSGLKVQVVDGSDKLAGKITTISDYRWIIEEDRTFFVDPNCTKTPKPAGCPSGIIANFGTNFHTSNMPVIASGCTGDQSCGSGQTMGGVNVVCNIGNGVCTPDAQQQTPVDPSQVALCTTTQVQNCIDPNKRYYISVLPGDAAQPFIAGYAGAPDCSKEGVAAGSCGHGMGGAPIATNLNNGNIVTVVTEPSPYPPATLSVFVFEDDYPLNGEHDAGGGIDVLSPNEPGLGGFQITLYDDAGGTGDPTGTPTYDMFNMPLTNSLAGTIDPVTKMDACPVATQSTLNSQLPNDQAGDCSVNPNAKGCQKGIAGMIITCPKYEADGKTLSPLAGQAVIKNLYQGRYGVAAYPAADRIARGEEWMQTNTLDGQKAHDSFMRIGEPGYFQEFGPAGYHVTIGFANPKIINDRGKALCATSTDCPNTVDGHVTTARMSRTPDERLYGSGTHDSYSFTQCYVSLGDPDGADFLFTKCDGDGNFSFSNVPQGNWKVTVFDQWNDQVVDGISTPVGVRSSDPNSGHMGEVAVHQWQSNIYTRTFIDTDFSGRSTDSQGNDKPGLPFVVTNIRFRDGSFSNFNNTDLNGYAGFNEVFPLFNWYVIETDSTRFKNTGTHVVYDAGGPVDGSSPGGVPCASSSTTTKPCGSSNIAQNLANTYEPNPLPPDLYVPGAIYCDEADCANYSIANGPEANPTIKNSTGRIDPAWVNSYGWQGFSGQNNFLEFGKKPFTDGENGGIHGHVVYASTRPFDDPQLLLQLSWEPLVPHVRINLYREDLAADGITSTLKLVDHTDTTSFDDWAQGFRSDGVPNMNCPGQGTDTSAMPDPYFWFGLKGQPEYLDLYNNGPSAKKLPHDSQFKCYDGMHNWNQLQPAPYDGMYSFPSVTSINPQTGKPAGTNCTGCTTNPDASDPYRFGSPMLPAGKYVVEVVVPPGFELVKEEDKNILIGDNYIAPVTQQFGGLGAVFILPDQAEVTTDNPQNSTGNLGRLPNLPSHEGDTGSIETFWPCVGEERIVPDYISLFPGSAEVAPFAGAKRKLCDRKEVTLTDQTAALAKFYLFTPTHLASHFTGVITDDFTAEFDPYSPQFGEKFAPAYLPVSFKDWAGNEITRIYADAFGSYNGLSYSTWEVNPPNPTGYGPTMMVGCMNDAGSGTTPDEFFQNGYSQFCYELPFMPGQTGYFDTPVVPTSAFAGGYNTAECSYPDATPAILRVDGDGTGPWIAGQKGTVTSVTVINQGSGYTGTPTVVFNNTGTGGTGAAAAAVINGSVTAVNLTNATTNRGYTSAPTITFTSNSGSGAAAQANMTNSVTSVSITNGGANYSSSPTVTFSLPPAGGRQAKGNATRNGTTRRITGVTITDPGAGYTSQATVSFSGGGGSGAAGTVNMGQSVASVSVSNGGSGYTSAPTVTFSAAGPGGLRATGTATQSAKVVAVNLTNDGSGYTSAPTISFTGGGGTGAAATAAVETSAILTIQALGDQQVDSYAYSGPSANAAPYNQLKAKRHYGFGMNAPTDFSKFPALTSPNTYSCNSNSATAYCPYVTVGGQAMTAVSWGDTTITGTIPTGVPACSVQQQSIYGGSPAQCGELSITAANGKTSVDTVTVTIGGKAPTVLGSGQTIQNAIDKASPGDLIIVPPGAYSEMLLMWKPVRLQGVGAAASVIDGNPHPAGKLDPWRRQVVCLFGLAMNGTPISDTNAYDSTGSFSCDSNMKFSVDRLPLEATVGWDATLNGNLAEQLIEPTIMGAYEGAGITVLGKGVKFPAGSDPFASDVFPDGTALLGTSDCLTGGNNPYPSNFLCNPSSIDGLTVRNSSQGGGGILVHAWGHNIQIANNRVMNNQGTLSGGITIGQGEHPDVYLAGSDANTVPGSCVTPGFLTPANLALPYCYDMNVNVHNNAVTQNSSLGDELFSSTPAGAGGVTFCNGSDYYQFNFNWVCGNMSTGDGAGVAHIGYSYNGDIEHNSILFNQSTNPTIVTNGGGLLIMGAPDADPPCGLVTDVDCVSAPGSISPSAGTGPGLVINANLIVGNSADSGSGGGLRLQHINGTDVLNFPNGAAVTGWPSLPGHGTQPAFQLMTPWNAVQVTNNIIANNVAGWDGGGVSLLDALNVNIINNTIVSNNSTASSGVLFQSLFAPLASTQGDNCTSTDGKSSCPQVAGLVSVTNSAVLKANIAQLPARPAVACPAGHGTNGSCKLYSVPVLYNNVLWQNRATIIAVGALGGGLGNQQNVVGAKNPGFGTTATDAAKQSGTGTCDDPKANYWDLGVRGDRRPGDHSAGTLSSFYSFLTNTGTLSENGNGANNQLGTNPSLMSLYCDGSRVPPEAAVLGFSGWQVPPGTNESNALPAPPFTLAAAATVDEGNNWINLRWGPLSLTKPSDGTTLFNPYPNTGSQIIDYIPLLSVQGMVAPSTDYLGNPRGAHGNKVDVGAIEVPPPPPPTVTSISPNSGTRDASYPVTITGTGFTGATGLTTPTGITVSSFNVASDTSITATLTIASSASLGAQSITVNAPNGTASGTFTVGNPGAPTLTSISPTSHTRNGVTFTVTLTGSNFITGATVNLSGSGTGITRNNTQISSDGKTITQSWRLSSTATAGARTVSVTTASGTSGTVSFTIQ